MSKRNRLAGYVNPPPVTTVSKEDILDDGLHAVFNGIGKGINFLVKAMKGAGDSPDPHNLVDEKGRKVYASQWVEKATQGISQFWANPKWVADNLNSHDIQAAKLASELSYKGRVFTSPVEALKQQEKIIKGIISKYQPGIATYANGLSDIENQAERMIETQSPEEVEEWMLSEAAKLKRPIPGKFIGPELVGGTSYVVSADAGYGSFKKADNHRANATKLNALDANTIVQTAKLILEHLETIRTLWDAAPSAGSGCDTPLWGKLEDENEEVSSELYDVFYFQREPEAQNDLIYYALMEWSETLYYISKWIHSQLTTKEVSLEALNLAKYFDDGETNPADNDQRAALFGTCAGSGWRERLIPLLQCAHFNPVVDEWTKEAQAQEELVKRTASAMVFVITPMQKGFFSFVEITDLAIKDPKRLYLCFLDNDAGHTWAEDQAKSIDAIKGYLTNTCGMTIYPTLEDLAKAVNGEVQSVSESDTPVEGNTVSQEGLFDAIKKSSPVTPNRTA